MNNEELQQAARDHLWLHYFPLWSYRHPPAIELAARTVLTAAGDKMPC